MKKIKFDNPLQYLILPTIFMSIVAVILTIINMNNNPSLRVITILISYALLLYYALTGYRKPHGNLLRYLILAYAFLLLLGNLSYSLSPAVLDSTAELGEVVEGFSPTQGERILDSDGPFWQLLITGISSILASYMAGRLNKFSKNKYIIGFILVILLIKVFLVKDDHTMLIANVNDFILWFDVACVYFARYHEHKEAGLISTD